MTTGQRVAALVRQREWFLVMGHTDAAKATQATVRRLTSSMRAYDVDDRWPVRRLDAATSSPDARGRTSGEMHDGAGMADRPA